MPVRGTVGELVAGSTGTPGRMPGAASVGFPTVTSEHADVLASTVTPVTTPARDSYASRAETGVGGGGATDSSASGANKVEGSPVPMREGALLSRLGSATKHQQKSEVSISRVGEGTCGMPCDTLRVIGFHGTAIEKEERRFTCTGWRVLHSPTSFRRPSTRHARYYLDEFRSEG